MIQLLVISSTFWWVGLIVLAFASVISFFNVDSAWSDAKKGRRGILVAAGVAFAIAAIGFLMMVVKKWG